MRFRFVAAGCFVLKINVDAMVSWCIWDDTIIAYMCAVYVNVHSTNADVVSCNLALTTLRFL